MRDAIKFRTGTPTYSRALKDAWLGVYRAFSHQCLMERKEKCMKSRSTNGPY